MPQERFSGLSREEVSSLEIEKRAFDDEKTMKLLDGLYRDREKYYKLDKRVQKK